MNFSSVATAAQKLEEPAVGPRCHVNLVDVQRRHARIGIVLDILGVFVSFIGRRGGLGRQSLRNREDLDAWLAATNRPPGRDDAWRAPTHRLTGVSVSDRAEQPNSGHSGHTTRSPGPSPRRRVTARPHGHPSFTIGISGKATDFVTNRLTFRSYNLHSALASRVLVVPLNREPTHS